MLLNIFTRLFTAGNDTGKRGWWYKYRWVTRLVALHCVTIRVKNRNKRELFLPLTAHFIQKLTIRILFRLFISLNYNLTKTYEIRVFHYKRNKYTKLSLHIHKEKRSMLSFQILSIAKKAHFFHQLFTGVQIQPCRSIWFDRLSSGNKAFGLQEPK